MKIASPPPTSPQPKPSAPSATPAPTEPTPPKDGVQLSSEPAPPTRTVLGTVGRMAKNLVINSVLGAIPAVGTAAALAIGGPTAAGLAIAGSMVAGGVYGLCALPKELPATSRFGGGGLVAGLSAAAGCIGGGNPGWEIAAGPALVAGFGAARECVGWLVSAGETGSLEPRLHDGW